MSDISGNGNPHKVDVLVFGPHPDDAELGTGGLLLKLHDLGYRSAIVDVTEGEMASGGSVEVRRREAEQARKILAVDYRENMGLPDGGVVDSFETRCKAARLIRKYQPTVIISTYYEASPPGRGQGHADHYNTGHLVSNAHNFAHLKSLPIEGKPWFATSIYYYMFPLSLTPSFVVDFTPYFDRYVEAIRAHESQFGLMFSNMDKVKELTGLPPFEMGARLWGMAAGGGCAHAFYTPEPLVVGNPLALVDGRRTILQTVDKMREQHQGTTDRARV